LIFVLQDRAAVARQRDARGLDRGCSVRVALLLRFHGSRRAGQCGLINELIRNAFSRLIGPRPVC